MKELQWLEMRKVTCADNGGDKDKMCTALGLEPPSWVDGMVEKVLRLNWQSTRLSFESSPMNGFVDKALN